MMLSVGFHDVMELQSGMSKTKVENIYEDTMQFFPLIVYPGTPDYEWAKKNNLMTVDSYDQWVTKEGLHNSVVKMPDMTPEEIVSWCDYARKNII